MPDGDASPPIIWQPQAGPQTMLLTCPIADIFFGGARGGGKSDALIGKAIKHMVRWGVDARGLVLRNTFRQLTELIERTRELTAPIGVRYVGTHHTFFFPGGGRLTYAALEREADAENYQGHNYTFIGVDEAGNFEEPSGLDRIRATLRSTNGVACQMVLTGNPGGPGHQWLKERYIDTAAPFEVHTDERSGMRRVFIPSLLSDNLLLSMSDPTYEGRIRASGPSWLVEAWLKGDWNATLVGKLIKLAQLRRYDVAPTMRRTILSVDCAVKDREWDSRNVVQYWGIGVDGGIYLLDEWADYADYGTLKEKVRALAEGYRPNALVVEDKGNGSPMIQELRADETFMIPVIAVEPVVNKVLRMDAETEAIRVGMVHVPRAAHWLPAWETEVSMFPVSKWKDRVDAMSQALWYLRTQAESTFSFDFGQNRAASGHALVSGQPTSYFRLSGAGRMG